MSAHQDDANANALWTYFQAVIAWVQLTFKTYRREMKGVDWGPLYDNRFKEIVYDPKSMYLTMPAFAIRLSGARGSPSKDRVRSANDVRRAMPRCSRT